jgi:hypothetical protein
MPVSGSWYYPAKNGAGFVISHNIYNTVDIAWFTYLSDGTPIWYIADTTEVNGEFTGTLLMTHWQNGQKTNIDVGQLTLNTTSSTTGTISWVLNGVPGSEPVEYLVFNDGGWSPNITGNWYDPNQPGWGILADVQGSKLVPTVALYDTAGQPTWVHYNGGAWNGSAFDSVLMQVTGVNLCPSCTGPTSFTYVNVGSMQVSNIYDSGVGFYNHATLNMSFTPPSGLSQWNRSNVALARLTF